jgi:acetyl esterase/lipase
MDVFKVPAKPADHRISYGPLEFQFGDLRLPLLTKGKLAPLVVFLHGGWWQSAIDLEYAGHLCESLKYHGIASWSLEYRRVGSTGGGWPTTFQDAAAGFDHISELAKTYPIDLKRVITMGHSAGGHLAFWLAGRHHIPMTTETTATSMVQQSQPKVPLMGAIALAGAVDLRMTIDLSGELTFAHDKREVFSLMGGSPTEFPDRYRAGNPGDLLPFGVPQVLVQGSLDAQIPPELPGRWAEMARRQGDKVDVEIVPGVGHRDVVDPENPAWKVALDATIKLLAGPR